MVSSILGTESTIQRKGRSEMLSIKQGKYMRQIGFIRVRKLPMLLAGLLTTSTTIANAETPSAGSINTIYCGSLIDGIAD